MQQIKGEYPPPHQKYLVQRGHYMFVATPCYGMHSPWWVPMTYNGETEPITIEPNDKWMALDTVITMDK